MRRVTSHAELSGILERGKGYIVNDRPDQRMLHRANCEALQAMTMKYPKLFFDEEQEAIDWLNNRYGKNKWEPCGRCR